MSRKEFVVVLRGESAVVLPSDGCLSITGFPTQRGQVDVEFRSRWVSYEKGVMFPGDLWIEVKGSAGTLEDALPTFANAALAILPVISFATNAAIGEPLIELGFEATPGVSSRPYFQQYVPPEAKKLRYVRLLDCRLAAELINAVARHPESRRVRRAVSQYSLALDSWVVGRASLSLAHLWMSIEALTKAIIRQECSDRGVETPEELASALGVELIDLDPTVRSKILMRGDTDCYKKAKRASDGFEHGFLAFDEIRELAGDTREKVARYVREFILSNLDLSAKDHEALLSSSFSEPMGHWPVVRYLRGALVGESEELAAPDNAYPFMKWAPTLSKCEITESGEIKIQIEEHFTAEIGPDISFQPQSSEVWKPS